MSYYDATPLLDFALNRAREKIQIGFAGTILEIQPVELLKEGDRQLVALSAANNQEYYTAVLNAQAEIDEKLKDQTLSAAQRQALQVEAKELNITIGMKMFGASLFLLQSNITYIEAVSTLEQGGLMELIENFLGGEFDYVPAPGSERMNEAQLEAEKKRKEEVLRLKTARIAGVVVQLSQLIRSALDALGNEQQELIKSVMEQGNQKKPIVIPMLPEESINGKKSKTPSAVA